MTYTIKPGQESTKKILQQLHEAAFVSLNAITQVDEIIYEAIRKNAEPTEQQKDLANLCDVADIMALFCQSFANELLKLQNGETVERSDEETDEDLQKTIDDNRERLDCIYKKMFVNQDDEKDETADD